MTSKKPINIAASIRSKLLNLSKERGEDYFIMPPCIASAKNENFDKVWNVGGFWQDIE